MVFLCRAWNAEVIQFYSDIPCQEMVTDDGSLIVINDYFIDEEKYELPPEFSSLIFAGETNALLSFKLFSSKNHESSEIEHQNIKRKTGPKNWIYKFIFNCMRKNYVSSKQSINSYFYQRKKSKRKNSFH